MFGSTGTPWSRSSERRPPGAVLDVRRTLTVTSPGRAASRTGPTRSGRGRPPGAEEQPRRERASGDHEVTVAHPPATAVTTSTTSPSASEPAGVLGAGHDLVVHGRRVPVRERADQVVQGHGVGVQLRRR